MFALPPCSLYRHVRLLAPTLSSTVARIALSNYVAIFFSFDQSVVNIENEDDPVSCCKHTATTARINL